MIKCPAFFLLFFFFFSQEPLSSTGHRNQKVEEAKVYIVKVKCLGGLAGGVLIFLRGGKVVFFFPRLSPIVSVFATKDRVFKGATVLGHYTSMRSFLQKYVLNSLLKF